MNRTDKSTSWFFIVRGASASSQYGANRDHPSDIIVYAWTAVRQTYTSHLRTLKKMNRTALYLTELKIWCRTVQDLTFDVISIVHPFVIPHLI